MGEEVVGVDDLLQRVAVGDHGAEVQAAAVDDLHQPAHALLAAGAERGDDAVVTEARTEGIQRDGEVLGVDPEARQGAAGLDDPQRLLEGLLQPQRLDGGVHAASAGELADLVHHVHLAEVEGDVGTHLPGHLEALVDAVHGDDQPRATQPGAGGGTQADGALGEHRHAVADPDVGGLRPGEAGGHDVRAHQHLVIGEAVGHRREVGLGIRHPQVLGLGAVDGVAEAPATHGLVAVGVVAAVLGAAAVLAGIGGEARADGAGNYPLALPVALDVGAELLDHPHRLMAHDQPLLHRVLALEDMHVGATDGGGGDPDQGVVGADVGDRAVVDLDAAGLDEDGGFHHGGHGGLLDGEEG